MNWEDLCHRPDLHNLPFKIELDAHGKVIMSPVKVYHSALQGELAALLRLNRRDGKILTECAIHTRVGTRVADAAWASPDTYRIIRTEAECSVAPEVCIEILSSSNTEEEIETKKTLYFEQGAREFWLCERDGAMVHFDPRGRIERSLLFPDFPRRVEIDA